MDEDNVPELVHNERVVRACLGCLCAGPRDVADGEWVLLLKDMRATHSRSATSGSSSTPPHHLSSLQARPSVVLATNMHRRSQPAVGCRMEGHPARGPSAYLIGVLNVLMGPCRPAKRMTVLPASLNGNGSAALHDDVSAELIGHAHVAATQGGRTKTRLPKRSCSFRQWRWGCSPKRSPAERHATVPWRSAKPQFKVRVSGR